jgi:hypothetical protein
MRAKILMFRFCDGKRNEPRAQKEGQGSRLKFIHRFPKLSKVKEGSTFSMVGNIAFDRHLFLL